MNPREVVNQIRARIVRESAPHAAHTPDATLDSLREQITRLRLSYEELHGLRHSVGRMPPSPNTRRARIGARLVRVVQRLLFWYTPQLHRVHEADTAVAESVCLVVEKELVALERLFEELGRLRTELRVRRADGEQHAAANAARPNGCPAYETFAFGLERDLAVRPLDGSRAQEFVEWLGSLAPPAPPGTWLDVGCGGGQWSQAVRAAGHACAGVESNAAAVAECRERGLDVQRADPIQYLCGCPDGQFAVIALLGVAGRHSMPYLFEVVREAARVLMPGGLILFESRDPANPLAACHDYWVDPAYTRPLPAAVAEYLLEYFGLHIAARHALDLCQEGQKLPFGELEFVRQLNEALYGPRGYALLARRDPEAAPPGRSEPGV